ncbi:MAG: lipoprotein-releasing ABC transporter permease subunit [Burkholderiaceae bacterium]|nr:lipoprotein-releasing ABC transporter permease subunit [Burkholderiaceae bacterium]
MLPYEIMIGLRYTRAGRAARSQRRSSGGVVGLRRNRFISFISGLATAGIALGVAALIVVLSVMNGFQKEVRDRMLSVLSHAEVIIPGGALSMVGAVQARVGQHDAVQASAPFVMAQSMISRDGQMRGILVRGIDPRQEPLVSGGVARLLSGKLETLAPTTFQIVLGRDLASQLGASIGDQVVLIAADGVVGPAGVTPRLRQFTVGGIFASGHHEYDSNLALIHAADATVFFRDQATVGVRLRLDDMERAPVVARELATVLSSEPGLRHVIVRDWSYENRNWFAAVQVEKRMMFIILTLIIAVAAFNLVSMLVMTVTDKRGDIAILRTLGAQRGSIMAIFVVQGAWLGLLGVGFGVVAGVLIASNIDLVMAWIEMLFGFQVLPKGIYFIDRLPSDLRASDVTQIGLMAIVLSFLATLYPSWRASRLEPAEALRYE